MDENNNHSQCNHEEMAFHITKKTIYIRCLICGIVAALLLDSNDNFTTNWAHIALEHRIERLKQEQIEDQMKEVTNSEPTQET